MRALDGFHLSIQDLDSHVVTKAVRANLVVLVIKVLDLAQGHTLQADLALRFTEQLVLGLGVERWLFCKFHPGPGDRLRFSEC